MIGSGRKRLLIALAFLLPNLAGFLLFTAGPVVFSLYMSLTDWRDEAQSVLDREREVHRL